MRSDKTTELEGQFQINYGIVLLGVILLGVTYWGIADRSPPNGQYIIITDIPNIIITVY